jgi:hypothetical protein
MNSVDLTLLASKYADKPFNKVVSASIGLEELTVEFEVKNKPQYYSYTVKDKDGFILSYGAPDFHSVAYDLQCFIRQCLGMSNFLEY